MKDSLNQHTVDTNTDLHMYEDKVCDLEPEYMRMIYEDRVLKDADNFEYDSEAVVQAERGKKRSRSERKRNEMPSLSIASNNGGQSNRRRLTIMRNKLSRRPQSRNTSR